jgi:hypothetical protein
MEGKKNKKEGEMETKQINFQPKGFFKPNNQPSRAHTIVYQLSLKPREFARKTSSCFNAQLAQEPAALTRIFTASVFTVKFPAKHAHREYLAPCSLEAGSAIQVKSAPLIVVGSVTPAFLLVAVVTSGRIWNPSSLVQGSAVRTGMRSTPGRIGD